jgi:hypothetical protein
LPFETDFGFSWSADGSMILVEEAYEKYIVKLSEYVGGEFKQDGMICPPK